MNPYFDRLNSTFAIAGLLFMAPLIAMAHVPTTANSSHSDSAANKRTALRIANPGHRTSESEANKTGQ